MTISNVNKHHEGRLDAVLEFDQREYGVLDWKTNNMNQASTGGKDRWQLISNILLANYRYSDDENNWDKFRFGAVIIKKLTFQIYPYSKIGLTKLKMTGNLLMRFCVGEGLIHKNHNFVQSVTKEENLLLSANFIAKIQD